MCFDVLGQEVVVLSETEALEQSLQHHLPISCLTGS